MIKLTRALLAIAALSLLAPSAGFAQDLQTTPFCGRTASADPGLIAISGGLLELGLPFKATMVTDGDNSSCSGTDCECTLGNGGCGDVTATAVGENVTGGIDTIDAPDDTTWSATGTIDTFNFAGSGPAAGGSLSTTVTEQDAPRLPANTIHPNFPSGNVNGSADVTVVVVSSTSPYIEAGPFTLTATVETTGEACSQFIPMLPVWGFPLLGIGMLGSAAMMLRKRA